MSKAEVPTHQLTLALEAVSDGVVALDREWRVVYLNRGAELLLRKQRQTVLNATWWDLFPYLLGTPAETELRAASTSTVQRRIRIFHPPLYAWHELDSIPSADGLLLIFRDVTDVTRLRQKEAVKEAVREILDPAPIAVSIMRGAEHRIEYMNPMSVQLLGGRNLEGRTVRGALPELEAQGFFAILDEVYRSGTPFEAKTMAVTFDRLGDGAMTQSFFDVTYQPFFETDGKVAGILSLSVEVAPPSAE